MDISNNVCQGVNQRQSWQFIATVFSTLSINTGWNKYEILIMEAIHQTTIITTVFYFLVLHLKFYKNLNVILVTVLLSQGFATSNFHTFAYVRYRCTNSVNMHRYS